LSTQKTGNILVSLAFGRIGITLGKIMHGSEVEQVR
jgi:hypothetical protein